MSFHTQNLPEIPVNTEKSLIKPIKPARNEQDIRQFLSYLGHECVEPEKEIFCFVVMDAASTGPIDQIGNVEVDVAGALQVLNINPDSTLHVALNRTNLKKKRKKENIVSARVLCVDIDRIVSKEEIQDIVDRYQPSLVVESSPQKYHIYWRIESALHLEMWSLWQLGLAAHFKGDLKFRDITHTIRVPGVPRIKQGVWITPRIVHLSKDAYDHVPGYDTYPWITGDFDIDAAIVEGKQTLEEIKKLRREIKTAHKGGKSLSAVLSKNPLKTGRNDITFDFVSDILIAAYKERKPISLEETINQAKALNDAFPQGPLPDFEIEGICRKVWNYSQERLAENKRLKQEILAEILEPTGLSLPVVPEVHLNGNSSDHSPSVERFSYDHSKGALLERPFSDESIIERVLQRFGKSIIRTGKIIYAFDAPHCVWRSQKGSHEIIQGYVKNCIKDALGDRPRLIKECIKKVGKSGQTEVSEEKLAVLKDKLYSHRIVSQSVSTILSEEGLKRESISAFDADPLVLFCKNGVVDLIRGTIRQARPEDMLLRQCPVTYNEQLRCPRFENFIEQVYAKQSDPADMVRCMQEVFGYTITGDTEAQVVIVHCGEGSNGKSRLMSVLAALLGDYSARLQAGALTKSKNSLEKEVARLGAKIEGKRVMIVDDLDTKTQWDSSLIKTLTDKTIIARNLYEEEKDIPNRATFHIGANSVPETEAAGVAMRRRIKVIPYKREFTVDPDKVKEIDRMIQEELPGILNWCIEGLARTQALRVLTADDKPRKGILWANEIEASTNAYWDTNAGIETHMSELFTKPSTVTDRHTMPEILTYLKECALKRAVKCELGAERVGRLLSALGFEKDRAQIKGERSRFYAIKFTQTPESEL